MILPQKEKLLIASRNSPDLLRYVNGLPRPLVLSPGTVDVNKRESKKLMGTIISKGTFFRFEEIAVPSPEWDEYCSQYASHGNQAPEPFEDDLVRVIYFRQTMLGGYILNHRHMRYRSYIHQADAKALETFSEIVWDYKLQDLKRVISVNCLWRRKNSGIIGLLASMLLYIGIRNNARFDAFGERMILAGAANTKLRKLYHRWDPAQSFQYTYHDGSVREMFLFHPDSFVLALYSTFWSIILFKWVRSSKTPEVEAKTESEPRIAA